MVFQVPASKASIKQNQFEFELPIEEIDEQGKKKKSKRRFSVPKMQYINSDLRERMQRASLPLQNAQEGDEIDAAVQIELSAIQRELFEKYAPGIYGLVTDDQILAIQQAWQEASSITTGESSPSAD